MRTSDLQQIEFYPPADCELFIPKELEYYNRKHHRDLKRSRKNDPGLLHCNVHVCTTVPTDVSAGPATVEITAGHREHQSENLILPACSPVAVCKEAVLPVYSSYSPKTYLLDSVNDTAYTGSSQEKKRMHAFGKKAVDENQEFESKETVCGSSEGHFNSSFSFIQQSLNSAFDRNRIVGLSVCSEPNNILQECKAGKSNNVHLHGPVEGQKTLEEKSWTSSYSCVCTEDYKSPGETIEDYKFYDFEHLSLLCANAALSCSTDSLDVASAGSSATSGYESSTNISDHRWNSLIKKYEPVLQECVLGNHSILKIQSLIIKLQKLQEKAVAADDYERVDKFRRKLEELESEKRSLKFQLPSQHPSISSFLDRFRTQVQTALYRDVHRFNRQETVFLQKSEQKFFSLSCREKIEVSLSKRDQLLKEKQWIQKEIELLRARLAVLEVKDQQLKQEIENQDPIIQLQDSELSTLLSWLSHEELQTIGKALSDTLEASHQIPCGLNFPDFIKRHQEKEQSLSISNKDTAAKVCTSQKLYSSLRRKASDTETQLPALLEAKMLAASERKLKENILKYMTILEEQLQSCVSQLLERIWEVDLEACQILIQEFQLKEDGSCVFGGEGSQTNEAEDTANALLSTKQGQSKHVPIKDSKQSVIQHPVTRSKHRSAHWESKKELPVLSTELEEKCEQISEKLLHLEDQIQTAICSCDESLSQSLQREIQMVKEALQAMLVQLQPAKEAEEDATAADLLGDS